MIMSKFKKGFESLAEVEDDSKILFDEYLSKFEANKSNYAAYTNKKIIETIMTHDEKFFKCSRHELVYLRFSLINTAYSTNVKYPMMLVNKIVENYDEIEEMICKGKIEELKNYIGVQRFEGDEGEIKYLSFFSKYCHLKNPEKFPIYDKNVKQCLYQFQKRDKFYRDESGKEIRLTHEKLNDYLTYTEVIDAFSRKVLREEKPNYVDIDRSLWEMGKEILN